MTLNKMLMRAILADAEKRASAAEPIQIDVSGYAPAVVSEHVQLAVEAEFLEAEPHHPPDEPVRWHVSRLTWKGHQELVAMRRGGVRWERG